jgi:hypothetical protein
MRCEKTDAANSAFVFLLELACTPKPTQQSYSLFEILPKCIT